MGWGTDFKASIYISRKVFNSNSELLDEIHEVKQRIEETQRLLSMYAVSNPKDIIPEDWKDDSINFINNKIVELLESYEEDITLLVKLDLLYETCLAEKTDASHYKD